MARDREFTLRQGRFKDLVLYIAAALEDDPTFGSTKLNKILYFSDTAAYRKFGEPITGAEYQRNHHGPTAREYPPLVEELEAQGYVTITRRKVVDHEQDVIKPTGAVTPNLQQFPPGRLEIVDGYIVEFRSYNNTQSSDQSHQRSTGWRALKLFKTIPYASSLISTDELSEGQMKRARQRSRDENWKAIRP